MHLKLVVFIVLVNLVVFLNCPHSTCTWFGIVFHCVSVHHGPPFSILGGGCACSRQWSDTEPTVCFLLPVALGRGA